MNYNSETSGNNLTDSSTLEKHMETNVQEKQFACELCSEVFSKSSDLISHKWTHSTDRRFKCDECDKFFRTLHNLKQHKSSHLEKEPFKCEICEKTFSKKCNLNNHQKSHSEERPFKCDECGQCFKLKDTLKSHLKTHSDSKPFKCDECGKCYKQLHILKTHKLIHSDQNSFKCDICNKPFTNKIHVINHRKIHFKPESNTIDDHEKNLVEDNKTFNCKHCCEIFNDEVKLKNHLSIHKEQPESVEMDCTVKIEPENSNDNETGNDISKTISKRRRAFTIKEKYAIIRRLENGESNSSLAKEFGIGHSTISMMLKNKDQIKESLTSNPLKSKRIRKSSLKNVDDALFQWFKLMTNEGISITGPMLRDRANDFASQFGILGFNCSLSWINRFKVRHNIIAGKIVEESVSPEHEPDKDPLSNQSSDPLAESEMWEDYPDIDTALLTPEVPIDENIAQNIKVEPCESDREVEEPIPTVEEALKAAELLSRFVYSNFENSNVIMAMTLLHNAIRDCYYSAKKEQQQTTITDPISKN